MRLTKVTFTGIDNQANLKELVDLTEQYPFVEFGVLWSTSRAGTPRYPDNKFFDKLVENQDKLNLACHLCGDLAKAVTTNTLSGKNAVYFSIDRNMFKRHQLNTDINSIDLGLFVCFARTKGNETTWIIQTDGNGPEWFYVLKSCGVKVHYLYDVSKGNGIEPNWYPSLVEQDYTYCESMGFAGGLSPDNIKQKLDQISEINPENNIPCWIDMESGVRTEDRFDIDKVRKVLEIAKGYISK